MVLAYALGPTKDLKKKGLRQLDRIGLFVNDRPTKDLKKKGLRHRLSSHC